MGTRKVENMKFIVILGVILGGISCSHHKFHLIENRKINNKEYSKIIASYTRKDRKYELPDEIYTFRAVFLSTVVRKAQLEKQRFYFQWANDKYNEELKKQTRRVKKRSEFLVSLYTPNRNDSNLQNQVSLWNFFLLYKSKRYKFKIKRYTRNYNEARFLYPNMDRWSRKYIVRVDISTEELEKEGFSLILSGREGQSILEFRGRGK